MLQEVPCNRSGMKGCCTGEMCVLLSVCKTLKLFPTWKIIVISEEGVVFIQLCPCFIIKVS